MNENTDFSADPPCELGHVFGDVCRQILYLPLCRGVVVGVILSRVDVKDDFCQIPVDPLHAAKLGYTLDEYTVVNLSTSTGDDTLRVLMTILISPLLHRLSLVTSSGMFIDGSYTSASAMARLPASCCAVSLSKTRSARFL